MRFFIKLFFAFWLTMILMGGLIAWTADHMRDTFEKRTPDAILAELRVRDQLMELLVGEGVERLRSVLSARSDQEQYLVFDESGQDILGRKVMRPRDKVFLDLEARHPFQPQEVISKEGMNYRIWMRPKRPSLFAIMVSFPWLLALMIALSGVVVLVLAVHFTQPIQRLRETSLRLAAGDLSARYLPGSLRLPDELSCLGRDFNFMAERLDHLFHSHKRLIRDISHELRSPLARMRVAIEMIHPGDSISADHLHHVEQEMERLNILIGQILTLSRFETILEDDRHDWIDVNGLIEALVVDVRFEADSMERTVVKDLCGEMVIRANVEQLRSALENVIRNALRHTPKGSSVFITTRAEGPGLTIQIRDQGRGVPEDQLESIFLPFYRVGEARDREDGGFGLGLAIASRVIEHHDGTIRASNHEEKGLIITIVLPAPALA
ncbi:MAG: HAMP domain-containing protein [Magnetococcales bacterium]|nr:HAMP domain-containing protein [Magnetococcales bacterium]